MNDIHSSYCYTANVNGGCSSLVAAYTPTVGCQRMIPPGDVDSTSTTLSIFGTTLSGEIMTLTATSPITETVTTTFEAPDCYVGLKYVAQITLVHQASDVSAAATSGGAGQTSASASGGAVTRKGPNLALALSGMAMAVGSVLAMV